MGDLEIDVQVGTTSRTPEEAAQTMADENSLRQLKNKCAQYSLNAVGKKIDLATRIVNHERHADSIVVVE